MPYVLSFDGSSDESVTLGTLSFTSSILNEAATFEVWIKTTETGNQTILLSQTTTGYWILVSIQDNAVSLTIVGSGTSFSQHITSTNTATITDGNWHHIALTITINFIHWTVDFYKDGQFTDSSTKLGPALSSKIQAQAGTAFTTTSASAFNGEMTDIRVWTTARTAAEIYGFYSSYLNEKTTGLIGYWPLSGGEVQNLVPGGAAGTLNGSVEVSFDTDPAWSPTSEVVYNVASQPFPAFTGDELTAYDYINSGLQITDLRSEYTNLVYDLDAAKSTIDSMTPDPSVSASAWQTVVSQLNAELSAASDVRDLYNQLTQYFNALTTSNQSVLAQAGALVSIEQQTTVSGSTMGLMGAILEAVGTFPVVGAPFGIVGSIVAAVAASSSATNSESSDQPFLTTYANLWNQLNTNFTQMLTQMSADMTAMLTDWGKLSSAGNFINNNILAWPVNQTSTLVTQSVPGCTLYYLQTFAQAMWNLYYLTSLSGGPSIKSPSDCSYLSHSIPSDCWLMLPNGMVSVVANSSFDTFPGQQFFDEVFDTLNVSKTDFFQGVGGWNMSIYIYNCCNNQFGFNYQCGVIEKVSNSPSQATLMRVRSNIEVMVGQSIDSIVQDWNNTPASVQALTLSLLKGILGKGKL